MQSENKSLQHSSRVDIQVLRGISVLLVMLYHANFSWISKGFLGVDIFFVISGYLITKIILSDMAKDKFSFKRFYLRRARRLLPAAYAVFILTALLSAFLLSTPRLVSLLMQLVGGITFTANMVLWKTTNYFTGSSDLLPLLHIWSLSLEEQFYFLLPMLLLLMPKQYRPYLILVLCILSLLLCVFLLQVDSSMTFYLLPTRAWELLLGSLLASAILPELSNLKFKESLSLLALIVIAYAVTMGFHREHPSVDAFLICLAVLFLLSARVKILNQGWHTKILAFVGDFSYSLYLVHWPLLSLARNVWIDNEVPQIVYFVLFLVAFPLAYLVYAVVEKPFREGGRFSHVRLRTIIGVSAFLMFIPVFGAVFQHLHVAKQDWNFIRRVNFGLSAACEYDAEFVWKKECASVNENGGKLKVLVWGDSFAMHLLPGLIKQYPDYDFIQATRSSCAPNISMAQVNDAYNVAWAKSCLQFNRSILDFLKTHPVDVVILAARLNQFDEKVYFGDKIVSARMIDVQKSFAQTVDSIKMLGARPIFFDPPPVNGADVGECLEKKSTQGFYMSDQLNSECQVTLHSFQQYQHNNITLLQWLESFSAIKVVWPSTVLCDQSVCRSTLLDAPLYRDFGHYTIMGSQALMSKISVFE